MKKALLFSAPAALAFALLAGCGEEPAPAPVETVAAPVPTTPIIPAPDETIFAKVFAEACPAAKKVAISSCRSLGMGETDFACKFGLGDDAHLRNDARLTPVDGQWTLVDPETTCAL